MSVHVTGKTNLLTQDETLEFLRKQVDKHEAHSACPVSIESMTEDFVRKEMRGIVAFTMTIDSIQGAAKLSQNRDDKNYQTIITELQKQGNQDADAIATEMAAQRPNIGQ